MSATAVVREREEEAPPQTKPVILVAAALLFLLSIGLAASTFCDTQPSSDACRRPWPWEPITIRSYSPDSARWISARAGVASTRSVVTLTSGGSESVACRSVSA